MPVGALRAQAWPLGVRLTQLQRIGAQRQGASSRWIANRPWCPDDRIRHGSTQGLNHARFDAGFRLPTKPDSTPWRQRTFPGTMMSLLLGRWVA
jgi:hypothetical protein